MGAMHEMRAQAPGNAAASVAVSVIVPTFRRPEGVQACLRSLLAQEVGVTFEIVVVDNDSGDDTPNVIAGLAAEDPRVRYLCETGRGVSFARNRGVAATTAPILAFIDDDETAAPDWLSAIVAAFEAHPEVDFIGGRVLPIWGEPCPRWLSHDHWAPAGLMDHGERTLPIGIERPWPLGTGNLALRRRAIEAVGAFSTDLQRVGTGIGSTEDHEFVRRLWRAGFKGLYVPAALAHSPVPPARMRKDYHRRWHHGHGVYSARMRLIEPPVDALTLFGMPAYYYGFLVREVASWLGATLGRRAAEAFLHEARVRDLGSYIAETYRLHRRAGGAGPLSELRRFVGAYRRKKTVHKPI
ncbi:glycosyltransferase [Piscinibacter koreensis]|uniref:Glycosyltransferase family 2 protein n=1 Tax=Piscinibacter koreensis TaxID=2742824 RepID=A0A7Y6NL87_9BURK|nr:glycosyltransferase family 2 protein [Schlegelella koreensis]NUZ05159.1 glycosyltransferase family 2 protein [Schlegelella koreensis]